MKPERIVSAYDDGPDTLRSGWTAVVSPQAVTVIFPNRHWEQMRQRDHTHPRAEGASWVDGDIDGLCESLNRALKQQVKGGTQ